MSFEWKIHIGAHKTATTFIQTILQDNEERISKSNMRLLVPTDDLRKLNLHGLSSIKRPFSMLAPHRTLQKRLNIDEKKYKGAILSEENLLGLPIVALSGDMYKKRPLYRAISQLSKQCSVKVFLSIRSPETFFPSLYSETLKHTFLPKDLFSYLEKKFTNEPPSWLPMILNIRKSAPDAKLCIWPYESFSTNSKEIIQALAGTQIDARQTNTHNPINKSGSAFAIGLAANLDQKLESTERLKLVTKIYETNFDDNSIFKPFSKETTVEMRKRYKADIQELSKLDGIELIR